MSSPLYFLASHQSIDDVIKRGIWYDTALNQSLDPIEASDVWLIQDNGETGNATDVKIQQYVRLTLEPASYLSDRLEDLASVCIVEVDRAVIGRKDVLKVQRIHDKRIEYLKNIMVDLTMILRIHTLSDRALQTLKKALPAAQRKIPIVKTPYLFQKALPSSPQKHIVSKPLEPPADSKEGLVTPSSVHIKILKGDLLQSSMQTLVNTVNCVGIMGKGIALAFKNQFPAMFQDYQKRCRSHSVRLGEPYIYQDTNHSIINFPTKNHWKETSNILKIEEGLQYLLDHFKEWGITSIAMPPLGCGNGHLCWEKVLPLMERYLCQMNIPVEIYAPHEAGSFVMPSGSKKLTPKRKNPSHHPSVKK